MLFDIISLVASWVLPFLLVLTLLVFIHEMGHYLVARYYGVRVEVFSIGFGPELLGWTDSKNTRWKVSLVPLGGYVRMFGDDNEASVPDFDQIAALSLEEKRLTLSGKNVWQRMAVSVAGPAANFVLTFLLLTTVFFFWGKAGGDPIIGGVLPKSAASRIGLEVGDKILSLNDLKPQTFKEIQRYVNAHPGAVVDMGILRRGEVVRLQGLISSIEIAPQKFLGVLGVRPVVMPQKFWKAPFEAARSVVIMSADLLRMLGAMVVSRAEDHKLGSVLSIAKMSKESLEEGMFSMLSFMALLSLNLGVINLLPVPMLDGGHLLFYFIEALRGRSVSIKSQKIAFKTGFAILMSLMLWTLWNDLYRFRIVGFFADFFK